jgi:flavoprotein hydroxylase
LILDLIVHDQRVFSPPNLQICDPARPTTVVSGGPGRRRWEFMRLPDETVEELTTEATAWRLLAPWNLTAENATLERHTVYTFQARWAERWRTGRVLLAGDAAHQMPPFAGQGMCSGLRDAANLAWKLSAVLAKRAPHTLLDTYQQEREESVRAIIDFSMELGKIICVSDPVAAAERDEMFASMVVEGESSELPPLPGFTAGVRHEGSSSAGTLFVQGVVSFNGSLQRFDDAFGAGWRLITNTHLELDRDNAAWFSSIGGTIIVLDEVADIDGTYASWLAAHDAVAVLQRPDFNVYGTAANTQTASQLISDLRSQFV